MNPVEKWEWHGPSVFHPVLRFFGHGDDFDLELRPSTRKGYVAARLKTMVDMPWAMPPIEENVGKFPNGESWLGAVRNELRKAGWEGDGKLRFMWVPNRALKSSETNIGDAAIFVKQDNNGTSFLFGNPVTLRMFAIDRASDS